MVTHDPNALRSSIVRHFGGPFVWGASDCVTAAAAVLADMGILIVLPSSWSSQAEAEAALRAHGGLDAAMDRALTAAGWAKICAPEPQNLDVGIVARGSAQSAAVFCAGRWHAKSPRGMLLAADALVMWRRA